jgi:hypothetical protein
MLIDVVVDGVNSSDEVRQSAQLPPAFVLSAEVLTSTSFYEIAGVLAVAFLTTLQTHSLSPTKCLLQEFCDQLHPEFVRRRACTAPLLL